MVDIYRQLSVKSKILQNKSLQLERQIDMTDELANLNNKCPRTAMSYYKVEKRMHHEQTLRLERAAVFDKLGVLRSNIEEQDEYYNNVYNILFNANNRCDSLKEYLKNNNYNKST